MSRLLRFFGNKQVIDWPLGNIQDLNKQLQYWTVVFIFEFSTLDHGCWMSKWLNEEVNKWMHVTLPKSGILSEKPEIPMEWQCDPQLREGDGTKMKHGTFQKKARQNCGRKDHLTCNMTVGYTDLICLVHLGTLEPALHRPLCAQGPLKIHLPPASK